MRLKSRVSHCCDQPFTCDRYLLSFWIQTFQGGERTFLSKCRWWLSYSCSVASTCAAPAVEFAIVFHVEKFSSENLANDSCDPSINWPTCYCPNCRSTSRFIDHLTDQLTTDQSIDRSIDRKISWLADRITIRATDQPFCCSYGDRTPGWPVDRTTVKLYFDISSNSNRQEDCWCQVEKRRLSEIPLLVASSLLRRRWRKSKIHHVETYTGLFTEICTNVLTTQRHCLLTTSSTTFRPKGRSLFLLWNNTSLGRRLGTSLLWNNTSLGRRLGASLLWNNTSLGRRLGDSIVEQCESSVQFSLSTSRFESRSWNSVCYLRHCLLLLTTWCSVGFLSVSVFVVINGQKESTLHAMEVAKLQHVGISEIYSTKAQICIMAACWK